MTAEEIGATLVKIAFPIIGLTIGYKMMKKKKQRGATMNNQFKKEVILV